MPLTLARIEASPVWLPTGLSLAAVLFVGRRMWPAILFAVTLKAYLGGLPMLTATGIGLAKAFEVLLGAHLMRRSDRFTGALDSVRAVGALVLGGAVLASTAGAILSVACLTVSGLASWSSFVTLASTWWLGDVMGVLILVPVALALVTPPQFPLRHSAYAAGAMALSLIAACELVFGRFVVTAPELALAYLPFPIIFWAAFRFGVHGAAISSCFAALYATVGTLRGFGPFARESAVESLILLETFMAVMVLTGLVLGAVITERRRVATALRASQLRYNLASSAGRAGVWDWHLESGTLYVDPVLKHVLGYEDHEIENNIDAWSELVHPDDLEGALETSRLHLVGQLKGYEVEHRMLHRDGSICWFLARGEAQRDEAGKPLRLTGTVVDITRQKLAEEAIAKGEAKIREQLSELENIYQTAPIGLALTDPEHRFVRINERLAALNGRTVEEHLGRSVREILPDVADDIEAVMNLVIRTGQTDMREIETRTPVWRGTAFAGHYPLIDAAGDVVGVGLVVQDITPSKRAEAIQAGNNRALELVARGIGIDEVMEELARNVESQTSYRCIVRRVADDGNALVACAAPSWPAHRDPALERVPIGQGGGACGSAAHGQVAVATTDVVGDPSWVGLEAAARTVDLRSCASVPILSSSGETLGTVAIYSARPGIPEPQDIEVAENAARIACVAIEHSRARDALTRSEASLRESHEQIQLLAQRLIAAQEEERRRVSRELHDGLNQQLAALSFEIGRLRSTVADTGVETRLGELQKRAVRLIDDARRMSHELHPSMLEHLGLVAAVHAYCDEASDRGSVDVRFDSIHPPVAMAKETALCLFRVVQEGVRNATKHSGATAIQVTLRSSSDTIVLAIADNGGGFDVSRRNGGLGLVSMAERVRAIGGDFAIQSDGAEGTRLEVRLALADHARAHASTS